MRHQCERILGGDERCPNLSVDCVKCDPGDHPGAGTPDCPRHDHCGRLYLCAHCLPLYGKEIIMTVVPRRNA
jgi:hypothetical protein